MDDLMDQLLSNGDYLAKQLDDMAQHHPQLGVLPRQTCESSVLWMRGSMKVLHGLQKHISKLEGELE